MTEPASADPPSGGRLRRAAGEDWAKLAGLVIAWRVLTLLYVAYATSKIPPHHSNVPLSGSPLLSGTGKWDAYYYFDIARAGYPKPADGHLAFFPLFPLLLRAFHAIGFGWAAGAAVLNGIAVYAACWFLHGIARDHTRDPRRAWRVVLLFLFFPTAFFLAVMYSEAVFCAFAFAAFYFARKRRWLPACLALAACTASRLPAVAVAAAVGVEYLAARGFDWRRLDRSALWLLLAPLGLVAFLVYQRQRYGNPFEFLGVYKAHWPDQRFDANVFGTFGREGRRWLHLEQGRHWREFADRTLGIAAYLLAVVVAIAGWRRLDWGYRTLLLFSLLLIGMTSTLYPAARYLLPIFPIYLIVEGLCRTETRWGALLAASATLMGTLLTFYAGFYWVS